MKVCKGEIKTFAVPVDENRWISVKEGEFFAEPSNGVSEWRIHCRKDGTNGGRTVFVTVDARPVVAGRRHLPSDPNRFIENGEIEIDAHAQYAECLLSVDLGNTRTVALLADGIGDGDGLRIAGFPMRFRTREGAGGARTMEGAAESIVSFVSPDTEPGKFALDDGRKSFVKIGEFAQFNNRLTGSGKAGFAGRHTLSSPKRYFWDCDPARQEWIAGRYVREAAGGEAGPLEGVLAERLCAGRNAEPRWLPPADVLSGMVAEIYEQACHWVASDEFKQKTKDGRPRRISRIHVTYPSTLQESELEAYRRQLGKGVQAYLDGFAGAEPVRVTSEIDEATAVCSVFAYSEMRKSTAMGWLRRVGRKSVAGRQVRIGVIDVGGGTADLSISAIEAYAANEGTDPFSANIDLLFRDGVNSAGDKFMFDFIERCAAKAGLDALWNAAGLGDAAKEDFVRGYNAAAGDPRVAALTKPFWYGLAIRLAVECDRELEALGGEWPEGHKTGFEYAPGQETCELLNRAAEAAFGENVEHAFCLEDGCVLEIPVTAETARAFLETARANFRPAARAFAKALSAYDADILLFSGKTAEFRAVRDVFAAETALPRSAITGMKDYRVGGWCGDLADGEGRIADSKVSTALGGALYSLRDAGSVNLKFTGLARGSQCEWGLVSEANQSFTAAMFAPGEARCTVPLNAKRLLIARKMKNATNAILSCEVRIRPEAQRAKGGAGRVEVTLERDFNANSLSVAECSGTFTDGSPVRVCDVECRICTMSGDFSMEKTVRLGI